RRKMIPAMVVGLRVQVEADDRQRRGSERSQRIDLFGNEIGHYLVRPPVYRARGTPTVPGSAPPWFGGPGPREECTTCTWGCETCCDQGILGGLRLCVRRWSQQELTSGTKRNGGRR